MPKIGRNCVHNIIAVYMYRHIHYVCWSTSTCISLMFHKYVAILVQRVQLFTASMIIISYNHVYYPFILIRDYIKGSVNSLLQLDYKIHVVCITSQNSN